MWQPEGSFPGGNESSHYLAENPPMPPMCLIGTVDDQCLCLDCDPLLGQMYSVVSQ